MISGGLSVSIRGSLGARPPVCRVPPQGNRPLTMVQIQSGASRSHADAFASSPSTDQYRRLPPEATRPPLSICPQIDDSFVSGG